MSYAAGSLRPSSAARIGARAGVALRWVTDATITASISSVAIPACAMALRDASVKVNDRLDGSTSIGSVKNLRDEIPVAASQGGVVLEWLVEDGDPVSPGQPLLRLHPSQTQVQEDLA